MRELRLANVLYYPRINVVGGIETYCYEMGLKYGGDCDITLLYVDGDAGMIEKIAETCRVIRYHKSDEIFCDTFILNYYDSIIDHVHAKEVIQIFHADYAARNMQIFPDGRVTKRFGVSDNTTNGILAKYDYVKDIVTMYNPYTPKKPRKVLKLVSTTRLSYEKGYERMVRFAAAMDAAQVPYHWLVFTDADVKFDSPNVSVLPTRHDILDFVADADYLVQLSDTEGYSYSILESLCAGTPVISTDIPVIGEQGVVNGVTGFILPMDLSEIPVEAICRGLEPFTFSPPDCRYGEVLSRTRIDVPRELPETVRIMAIQNYFDAELGRNCEKGEARIVAKERAKALDDLGVAAILW